MAKAKTQAHPQAQEPAVTELGELDAIKESGRKAAERIAGVVAGLGLTQVQLYTQVAEFETREAANAFIKGYQAACEDHEDKGNKTEQESWATVKGYVSRMKRVMRAAFGINVRQDDDTMRHVSAWTGKDGEIHDYRPEDQRRTLNVLEGKGGVNEKLDKLPRGKSGRGASDSAGITPIQKRINAADNAPASGSLDLLAKVLNVGGKEIKTDKDKATAAKSSLIAAIKSAPDAMVMDIVQATVSRMLTSKDESIKDMGISFRDHLTAATRPGAKADRKALREKAE